MKGRRLNPSMKNWRTRPTTDQAKEGLFNMLNHRIDIEGSTVLDLCSGSGSVGLEFVSRGAKVHFVERFKPCIEFIKSVIVDWQQLDQVQLHCQDVTRFVGKVNHVYDIVFADPPYDSHIYDLVLEQIFTRQLLKKDGILILEHDKKHTFTSNTYFDSQRAYGQTIFSFFSHQ